MSLNPRIAVARAVSHARDKKSFDITVLDISGISVICDYFVICSGTSTTHVKAIAGHIKTKMAEEEFVLLRSEGFREGLWVLLDYGDIVVHVFLNEEREFYNLERLWGDAKVVANNEITG
ncbi:MAG TPA: ribosome silencing factor [Clostridia bacterium]|nr:ribosome silencing factor [Clostridia bacterium]